MAGITFRDKKHNRSLDAGFSLWNGKQLGDVSKYQIGDVVGVCFADQHEKQKAIRENCPVGLDFFGNDGFVQVRCVVVVRHHGIVWRDVGKFEEITGCGIVLEGETGYWEDVLKWIVINERPDWIPENWDSSSS